MQGTQRKSEAQTSTSNASAVAETKAPDEGFNRWYSTIESLVNKLSAPLAYAGIPLMTEDSEPSAAGPPKPRRPSSSKSITSESDLGKIFSRAALRATARSSQSDSFYVVPSTGGTVSYAGIMKYEAKEQRRLQQSMHSQNPDFFEDPDEADDFVDAREAPMSPTFRKKLGGLKAGHDSERIVEELYMENKSLKQVIDRMSKRLHAFEAGAQSSTMALQESMRVSRPSSPTTTTGDAKLAARVRELEEQAKLGMREVNRLDRENEKLKSVVMRYREKWDKLKEGARTRRDGSGTGPASTTESTGK
jgi:hypothetical protein